MPFLDRFKKQKKPEQEVESSWYEDPPKEESVEWLVTVPETRFTKIFVTMGVSLFLVNIMIALALGQREPISLLYFIPSMFIIAHYIYLLKHRKYKKTN